jgi:anti-anti-sigma factor
MKELSVAQRDEGPVRVIELTGFLDAHNSLELCQALDATLKAKRYHAALDLKGLQYMGSAGIEAIISRLGRFRDQQGDIRLAAAAPKVIKVFELLGLAGIINFHPSVKEAVAAFSAA